MKAREIVMGFGMLFIFAGIGLTACTQANVASNSAAVNVSLATAQADAQKALAFYGIAKGIALAAEVANPTLAPMVNSAIATLDPIAAKIVTALASASTDAVALEALVVQVNSQANDLTVSTAPAIKVVPAAS